MAYQPTTDTFDEFRKRLAQEEPQSEDGYRPTIDTFNEFRKRAAQEKSEQKYDDVTTAFLKDPTRSALGDINDALKTGITQGLLHGGTSLLNIPVKIAGKLAGKDWGIPYPDLSEYVKDGALPKAAYTAGEIGGEIGAFGGASKIANAAIKPASIIGKTIAEAAAGGAISGSENEKLSRGIGAGAGGLGSFIHSLMPRTIGKNILNQKKAVEKVSSEQYDKVFDALKKAGIHKDKLRVPTEVVGKSKLSIDLDRTQNKLIKKALNEFKRNPTFKNAHKAQSKLGELERGLTASGDKVEEVTAKRFKEKIKGSMQQFLLENNKPVALKDYQKATTDYVQKVVPYKLGPIEKLKAGEIKPKHALKELMQHADFNKPGGIGSRTPGYGTYSTLGPTASKALSAALGMGILGTGAKVAYEADLPLIGSILRKGS
jgi:hypothetical protein